MKCGILYNTSRTLTTVLECRDNNEMTSSGVLINNIRVCDTAGMLACSVLSCILRLVLTQQSWWSHSGVGSTGLESKYLFPLYGFSLQKSVFDCVSSDVFFLLHGVNGLTDWLYSLSVCASCLVDMAFCSQIQLTKHVASWFSAQFDLYIWFPRYQHRKTSKVLVSDTRLVLMPAAVALLATSIGLLVIWLCWESCINQNTRFFDRHFHVILTCTILTCIPSTILNAI